jgi:hypothetical protein
MNEGDKLAAATLAAARCATPGQTDVASYFVQYEEFVRLFEQRERAGDEAEERRHAAVMDAALKGAGV